MERADAKRKVPEGGTHRDNLSQGSRDVKGQSHLARQRKEFVVLLALHLFSIYLTVIR